MNKIILKDLFCQQCSQFDKKYVFDLHLSLVHGWKMKIKQESSEENPERETSNSSDRMDQSLNCDFCDSTLKSKGGWKMHIRSVHEEKKPLTCNICKSRFSQKSNLNKNI